ICNSCLEHFEFGRPDLMDGIRRLKRQALEDAIRDDYSDVDIQKLRNDLQRYESTDASGHGNGVPCPWNPSQPAEVTFPTRLPAMQITHQYDKMALNIVREQELLQKSPCHMLIVVVADLDLVDDELLQSPERDKNSLQFLLHEFETCINEHNACGPAQTSDWIPTRLLDVQLTRSTRDCVTLVERSDVQAAMAYEQAKYLTLSHVWGSSMPLCLTKHNYLDMKTGVPVDTLPGCFKDAVYIARKLHIRYLWIDSLCILQDSLQDWEREAMTMDRVYMNGICNIAACDIGDSNLSMLSGSDGQCPPTLRIRTRFIDGATTFVVIPDWVRLMRNHAPLYKRAWVVQERFLSRRLMHLSRTPVWECHKALVTPTYHQGMQLMPADYADFLGTERGWVSAPTEGVDIPLTRWLHIVEIYSRCALTCPDDKLVALGGLAKLFSTLLREDYHAGIWGGKHLIPCLLWTPVGQSEPYSPTSYRAPSWSWASIDGQVQMTHNLPYATKVLIQCTSISVMPKTGHAFGQVTAGEFRLKGRLFEILDIATRRMNLKMRGQCRLDYGSSADLEEKTYFLPLAKIADKRSGANFQGLFVQEAVAPSDTSERKFKRVGMGTILEHRDVVNGSTDCNILDDVSWESLLLMSKAKSEEDMQAIVMI
ncbi:HET-domain-containing protein, partial [Fusarium austroafricanum]